MPCKPTFYTLEDHIRKGIFPDKPEYLRTYLEVAQECARNLTTPARHKLYKQVFLTLTLTAADKSIALHWRMLCLDHACFPLCRLDPLCRTTAQKQELRQFRHQLANIGQYFH